jgi:hypothetical protein
MIASWRTIGVLSLFVAGAGFAASGTAAAIDASPTVSSNVYSPPSTIAADCSADVTIPLWDWLYSLPQGTAQHPVKVLFAKNGCYLINGSEYLRGFTNVILDGNGSTFKQATATDGKGNETYKKDLPGQKVYAKPPQINPEWCNADGSLSLVYRPYPEIVTNGPADGMFDFEGGCNLTVEYMNVVEAKPADQGGYPHQPDSAFGFAGTQRVLFTHNSELDVWGDFVTTGGLAEVEPAHGLHYPATDITITDNTLKSAGRCGFGLTEGLRISITNNVIEGYIGLDLLDLESDWGGAQISDINFAHNTVSSRFAWALASLSGANEDRVNFSDNTFSQSSSGFRIRVGGRKYPTYQNFNIVDNVANNWNGYPWPDVDLVNIHNVAISGNATPVVGWQRGDTGPPHMVVRARNTEGVDIVNNHFINAHADIHPYQGVTVATGKVNVLCGNVTNERGKSHERPCDPSPGIPLPTAPAPPEP